MKQKVLALLMLCAVGCSGGPADEFSGPRGQVTGKVTYKGQPVPEGSSIMFLSKPGKKTYTSVGTVGSGGSYTLYYKGSPNVPTGEMQIQIVPPAKTAAPETMNPAEMSKPGNTAKADATKPPFPARYNTVFSSELIFTIKEGANTADFDLTD